MHKFASGMPQHSLDEILSPWLQPDWRLHSRIHPLNGYIPSVPGRQVFMKRDDELSSGITGSKYRKYAGLLPYLLKEKFDELLLIGSAFSNHVTGLLQILNEYGVSVRLVLLESHGPEKSGNFLFSSLLYPMKEALWISRDDWPHVHEKAEAYASEQWAKGKRVCVLPEGAALPHAVIGAMSLAADILTNEKDNNIRFEHILADSGTGTTAIGMLLGFALAKNINREFHIRLIAGDEDYFRAQYARLSAETLALLGVNGISLPKNLHFHKPVTAPSFGALNQAVLQEVKIIARQEGILMEPLYGVKHLMTAQKSIAPSIERGNILFINSGGSLGLAGFQHKLASV